MKMRTSFLAASAVIACAALALGCSDSGSPATAPTGAAPPATAPPAATRTVDIEDFRFGPSSVTIAVGTAVKWRNNGPSTHTTTSDDGVWSSGNLGGPGGGIYEDGSGGEFNQVFPQAGTFKYHCSIHPQMMGTVTVTE
jgi:plastocyanin